MNSKFSLFLVLAFILTPPLLLAQSDTLPEPPPIIQSVSRADSLRAHSAHYSASRATALRILIDTKARRLFVVDKSDTIYRTPVAIATGSTLSYKSWNWTFKAPYGVRRITTKKAAPIWTPPLWHYAEVASLHGLRIAHLDETKPTVLSDGRILSIRSDTVGLTTPNEPWQPMEYSEEIVFDGVLYIAPPNTLHGFLAKELGPYALYLGDGYLLHGTPDPTTVGTAATHGCFRLLDPDITWLYENIPLGTKVYIY